MHEPLKGPVAPSSPISAQSAKKRISYEQARTRKPETERIRKMRTNDRSISPSASSPNNSSRRSRSIAIGGGISSPNNSSRRSRSIAVDKAIQNAKEKVHKLRNNSTDTMMSSNHTNASTISASAILDKRRPLHQDADGTIAPRPASSSKRVSTVNENDNMNVILGICGSGESSTQPPPQQQQEPSSSKNNSDKKQRNGKVRRRSSNGNRRDSNSASPMGRRPSNSNNQRRIPAHGQYNDEMDSSSDEEVDYNDRVPRPIRKPNRTSRTGRAATNVREVRNTKRGSSGGAVGGGGGGGILNRNTQSLSPTRPKDGGKIRDKKKSRVESVSSLSGSDSDTGRRSRRRREQKNNKAASANINQSERTDEAVQHRKSRSSLINNQSERSDLAVLSTKSPSLSPYRVPHSSRKMSSSKLNGKDNNNNVPPPPPSNPFQSPSGTRGTVSPLSSPSHHTNAPEDISPLTTSTKSFLNGPIRMQIPWAKEADMGGAKKEPRKMMMLTNNEEEEEDGAEAEDSFEMMTAMEQSYDFGQLEVDRKPIRPDRLSSIRSLSYKERHLRSSYPHELEMYKGKSPNDPDYMPNQPTRHRASTRSSMGSTSYMMGKPSSGTNRSSRGRVSMFGNSYAHELDLYKYEKESEATGSGGDLMMSPSMDKRPQRPIRLASMQSLKLNQSSGDFSIGTYDTYMDGEFKPAENYKTNNNKNKKSKEKKSNTVEAPKKTDEEDEEEENDEIESLDDSTGKASTIRSVSPRPKEKSKGNRSPIQAPHTVGGTAKKRTIFLSPLAKINLPKSPGSLRGKRTFGWKNKDDPKDSNGDKQKSWLASLGGKGGSKPDKSETEGSKRSTRSSRTNSKRSARTAEVITEEKSPAKDQSPTTASSLGGIKQAFQNRRGRSSSPHGVKAASKKKKGRSKRKKKQTTDG